MSSSEPSIAAIIPAGGIGKRMQTQRPKQFLTLHGKPVLVQTLQALAKCSNIRKFIVPAVDLVYTRKIIRSELPDLDFVVISGGKTRQESVYNGLLELKKSGESFDYILVHDAVRALVQASTINEVVAKAIEHGAAIAASPVTDTLKQAHSHGERKDLIRKNIPRESIWIAQTPQVYAADMLLEAYDKAKQDHYEGTDSAGLVERLGRDVYLVESPKSNVKITTPDDLSLAEAFLSI